MNEYFKTDNRDYIIAIDTDSIYITLNDLVKKTKLTDEKQIVKMLDMFCEKMIQPVLQQSFDGLSKYLNAYQQKMSMKREIIASKGIWRGKKMYILNVWNKEGVQFDKPKLKYSGIEVVRSSTPHACKAAIKEALTIIMNGTETELQEYIKKFHDEYMVLPFGDIAFPRGINDLAKYSDTETIYSKGAPIHVKGALLYNRLIKQHNLINLKPIYNGDKIKFCYLSDPNPIHDTVIGTPDTLPPEFGLDKYINREMQFEKSFLAPIESFTDIIGWKIVDSCNLDDFEEETERKNIFVFGSNLAGRHGKGAALTAKNYYGAVTGRGIGFMGESYAIPTKNEKLITLSLTQIKKYVTEFKDFARQHPEYNFMVTSVGCGLAGYTPEQIAPFFKNSPSNCQFLSKDFKKIVDTKSEKE